MRGLKIIFLKLLLYRIKKDKNSLIILEEEFDFKKFIVIILN